MRYLGNLSAHDFNGINLTCRPCGVSWRGCMAAADCPECGRGYSWDTGEWVQAPGEPDWRNPDYKTKSSGREDS